MIQLSSYVLTKNSEKYIAQILHTLSGISEEVLVIDSGSTDGTERIACGIDKVRFIHHDFENFKAQRLFAEKSCTHDMVLFLDSDEIPDEEFSRSILEMKHSKIDLDAYRVTRNWNVLGKMVHCIYPVTSPDNPIRLYNRTTTSFDNSQLVHEAPTGYKTQGRIQGSIKHHTFETKEELNRKLEFYTDIAAQDLIVKGKTINAFKMIFNPIASFFKWYFIKNGYKDGLTGLTIGGYAYSYTLKKYQKAKLLRQGK